ncbi:hypothetical protein [Rikenella microfusus]|uniref:hypothetical protein n=1 Tax=Rikenella microfusus TaxID=28139 RepID=UPI00248E22E2|nr:hypothetical protein [Rikenella microfusus]
MNKEQQVMMSLAAYEMLAAQIETLPYALAKPLLQLLRSNAEPVRIEIPEPNRQEGGGK